MSNSPHISVILPVYNGADYLRDAIDSILKQTFESFEFLIINDGSNDRSEEIILSYQDQRIRYICNEKNIGLIATLNKGISESRGLYIARMDADDVALPERLDIQLRYMAAHSDCVVCGSNYFQWQGDQLKLIELPEDDISIKTMMLFRSPLAHPTVMLRGSVFIKQPVRYEFAFPSAEDYRLWTQLAPHGTMHNVQKPLLKYRMHSAQVTQTKTFEKERSLKFIIRDYLAELGISVSEEEFELLYRCSGGRGARTLEELESTGILLLMLEQKLHNKFPHGKTEVSHVLGAIWRKTFENSGLGIKGLRTYRKLRTLGSKEGSSSARESMKMLYKIITKYKAH